MDEIRRIIREEDPPRPSTRLSTLDAAEQTAVANRRHSEPPKLLGLVRGDLDWIVMKTLEKDRNRRYETANGLASGHPAAPEQRAGRRPPAEHSSTGSRRLVRRNKLAFAAGAAVAAALVIGLGLSMWLFLKEKDARREAERQRQQARFDQEKAEEEAMRAERNAAEEKVQRELAVQASRRAKEALLPPW